MIYGLVRLICSVFGALHYDGMTLMYLRYTSIEQDKIDVKPP